MPYIFCNCTHCKQQNAYETAALMESIEGHRLFRKEPSTPELEEKPLEIRVVCKHCLKPYKVFVPRSKLT